MIIRKEKKNGITIFYVKKDKSDIEMEKLKGNPVSSSLIKDIITDDTDVYTEENKLLLKFRKNKLNKKNIHNFYENVIDFAKKSYSTNRGSVSGSRKKNVSDNPKIMSNVIGYMDNFSPNQKFLLKQQKKTVKYNARECRFNVDYQKNIKN